MEYEEHFDSPICDESVEIVTDGRSSSIKAWRMLYCDECHIMHEFVKNLWDSE